MEKLNLYDGELAKMGDNMKETVKNSIASKTNDRIKSQLDMPFPLRIDEKFANKLKNRTN